MPLPIALTFFVFAFSTLANAWSPFAGKDIAEVALTPLELQKIKVAAGWAKGEDLTCRVSSDQSQLDCLASVDKSIFKPAMNSAGVR